MLSTSLAPARPWFRLSVRLSAPPSVCPSVRLFVLRLFVRPSVPPFVRLSVRLCVRLSVRPVPSAVCRCRRHLFAMVAYPDVAFARSISQFPSSSLSSSCPRLLRGWPLIKGNRVSSGGSWRCGLGTGAVVSLLRWLPVGTVGSGLCWWFILFFDCFLHFFSSLGPLL